MQFEAVIFDMDGLMIDSEQVTYETYIYLLSQRGLTITRDFYLTLLGNRDDDIRASLQKEYGRVLDVDELFEDTCLYIDNRFDTEGVPLKKGLTELLSYLRSRGIKTVIATGSVRERVDHIIELAGLEKCFDASVCGDEVKTGKPDPEMFLAACAKAGTSPEKTLVLEDSEAGIEAAYRGNIPVICVPDMKPPGEEFAKKTLCILDSLLDVKDYLSKGA